MYISGTNEYDLFLRNQGFKILAIFQTLKRIPIWHLLFCFGEQNDNNTGGREGHSPAAQTSSTWVHCPPTHWDTTTRWSFGKTSASGVGHVNATSLGESVCSVAAPPLKGGQEARACAPVEEGAGEGNLKARLEVTLCFSRTKGHKHMQIYTSYSASP